MYRNELRISCAILSVAALLGLAACGGGDSDSTMSMMDGDGMTGGGTGGGMTGGGTGGGMTGGGMTGGGTGGGTPVTVSFGAGVERDHASSPETVALLADDGMPMVQQTDDGLNVTVDGQTVAFTGAHLGTLASFPDAYYRTDDPDEDHFLLPWSGTAAYDYTNLYSWAVLEVDRSHTPASPLRADVVYFVQGTLTSDMPVSGSATYSGFVRAWEWPESAASVFTSSPMVNHIAGRFGMMAQFGASGTAVTGEFSNLEQWAGNSPRSNATAIPGSVTFTTTVSDNRLSIGGLSGTGPLSGYENISVTAGFFGPGAAEVAGVFEGENPTQSTVLTGGFAGKQQ